MPKNRPSIKEIALTLSLFHGIMEVERMPPDKMERSVVPMAEKKREIIPVTNDVMFKALFVDDSEDYELLRSFLSAALMMPKVIL